MQIYLEVYKTEKPFFEKRAVVRINCAENMKLFHFCGIILFMLVIYLFGLCKGSYSIYYQSVCYKSLKDIFRSN